MLLVRDSAASPGYTDDKVFIGMSAPLSGSAAVAGKDLTRGIAAYLKVANMQRVHGRQIILKTLDDNSQPSKTAANIRTLIEEHNSFAVIASMGTQASLAASMVAAEKKIPLFGAKTSAEALGVPPRNPYIITFRASHKDELEVIFDGLISRVGIPPQRVAFFTERGPYGEGIFNSAAQVLEARGYHDILRNIHGRYPRGTTDIEDGLERVLDARILPMAIILAGSQDACAKFINMARQEHFEGIFVGLSTLKAKTLGKALIPKANGYVVTTQVVPPPTSNLPAVRAYRKTLGASSTSFTSLEGWLTASALVAGLHHAGPNLKRTTFLQAFSGARNLDLGLNQEHKLANNQQLSDGIWPVRYRSGRWQKFSWRDLRRVIRRRIAQLTQGKEKR